MAIVLYLALGVVVGILSGIIGIGGGIIVVPVLVFFAHMSQHRAQGTSLGALLLPTGVLAFWKYYKAGNADLTAGLVIAVGFFIGGYFGGMWAQQVPEAALRKVFALALIAVAITLLRK